MLFITLVVHHPDPPVQPTDRVRRVHVRLGPAWSRAAPCAPPVRLAPVRSRSSRLPLDPSPTPTCHTTDRTNSAGRINPVCVPMPQQTEPAHTPFIARVRQPNLPRTPFIARPCQLPSITCAFYSNCPQDYTKCSHHTLHPRTHFSMRFSETRPQPTTIDADGVSPPALHR
jgi:hypothetical protein